MGMRLIPSSVAASSPFASNIGIDLSGENGLTLLDNAIEDTGAGVIAGTTAVVPEPGFASLS